EKALVKPAVARARALNARRVPCCDRIGGRSGFHDRRTKNSMKTGRRDREPARQTVRPPHSAGYFAKGCQITHRSRTLESKKPGILPGLVFGGGFADQTATRSPDSFGSRST